ncbi:MAG: bifunctional (p)ppGpp synthetase/guanosine-3',5'-bis(diphosphate) 3'-pyrophosphohydrolase [Deltaproteobacteria bacterium]|nr:bifunctional (p)ppGpp synthetase/guanosine-3',5'-bis(diphosphate) 3'-pyrophosphohydrolase [Deltaproteobacteria bacterium]MCX7952454.1 bifunctional (p)ppGpp synthetase/guanosine-3',5'-bis(diphosphate) 3'-pyrophosphohydrolase [Deltaproteobacteria bacterium]
MNEDFFCEKSLEIIPYSVLLREIAQNYPNFDGDLLNKAYNKAVELHGTQLRLSGEPFVNHVIKVAILCSEFKFDFTSVCAALLHDTLEDTSYTLDKLRAEFGNEIALLVEGVTKLSKISMATREEKQAENFRKLLLAMSTDIRVILVKLCDRLHNMMTLDSLPEPKRKRVAEETQEIYAPLANRLGLYRLKALLEDYALRELKPNDYWSIKEKIDKLALDIKVFAKDFSDELQRLLEDSGISAKISYRLKNIASVYAKMVRYNCSFEQILDILGFRVIVPTVISCYEALGIIHSKYQLVPGRIKDYIAMPKPNMYQSLHTTVVTSSGQRVEIQIRTPEMHQVAEQGVAAHWRYKDSVPFEFDLSWVRDLVETQKYISNPEEFLQSVKSELFQSEIYVFSPKGDLFRLPRGATPLDFAYAVHTEIGHATVGARVNGTIVPLGYKLKNGDVIEIMTQKEHKPSKDWLKIVVTSKAKNRIKQFLRQEKRAFACQAGKELLVKELSKKGLSLKKLEKSAKFKALVEECGFKSIDELYANLYYGKIAVQRILLALIPEHFNGFEELDQQKGLINQLFQSAAKSSNRTGIKVSGYSDVFFRFAKCCQPLPGDRIVGYITKGKGLTIHSVKCPEIHHLDPLRFVPVEWDSSGSDALRTISLEIYCKNEIGMLSKLCLTLSELGINIASASAQTFPDDTATILFDIQVKDVSELERARRKLLETKGVVRVERVFYRKPTTA